MKTQDYDKRSWTGVIIAAILFGLLGLQLLLVPAFGSEIKSEACATKQMMS